MTLDVLDGVRLPEGWTARRMGRSEGYAEIVAPMGHASCFVTVDFANRGFRGGGSTTGRMASTLVYTGRGWRQRLIQDAIAWLRAVVTP